MKLLIGAVVALLCMQTIKASSVEGRQCKKALETKNDEINEWFRLDFNSTHDKAHTCLNEIVERCTILTNKFNSLPTNPTVCQIVQFLKVVIQLYKEAVKWITELQYYISLLIVESDQYKFKEILCKKSSSGSRCKAVDDTVVELIGFLDALHVMGADAKNDTAGLGTSCDALYEMVYKLNCVYKPCCLGGKGNCGVGSVESLITYFNGTFRPAFEDEHNIAHTFLLKVITACQDVLDGVAYWDDKTKN